MDYSAIQHIPCWGRDVKGVEWLQYLRRSEAYSVIHYWQFHPAHKEALANAVGFASKGDTNV